MHKGATDFCKSGSVVLSLAAVHKDVDHFRKSFFLCSDGQTYGSIHFGSVLVRFSLQGELCHRLRRGGVNMRTLRHRVATTTKTQLYELCSGLVCPWLRYRLRRPKEAEGSARHP